MAPHRGILILLIQVTCDRLKAFAGGGTAYKTKAWCRVSRSPLMAEADISHLYEIFIRHVAVPSGKYTTHRTISAVSKA